MDWDKEVNLEKCEDMITVYEKHINVLEKENKELKVQVAFLKEQLYLRVTVCQMVTLNKLDFSIL